MAFLAELLQRPDNEQAFLVLPVGYPADDCEVPDIERRPLDDVTVWV
jgi:iodotyrosine deiodinase